jgi:hypothetical protein
LPMTGVAVWHNVTAVLGAVGARIRLRTVPEASGYDASVTTAPRSARQIVLYAMREEEQRLLR